MCLPWNGRREQSDESCPDVWMRCYILLTPGTRPQTNSGFRQAELAMSPQKGTNRPECPTRHFMPHCISPRAISHDSTVSLDVVIRKWTLRDVVGLSRRYSVDKSRN